ncbi:hypothetical protein KDL45_13975, partial [bacterium]|nr:hypothetical protein [bacterium]
MSDETAVNVGAVVKNLSQANNLSRQAEILGRAITTAGPGPAVEMMGTFMDRALDDLGYARGFLLCIDYGLLNKTIGGKVMDQLKFHMNKHAKFAPLDEILEQTKNMDQSTLMYLKAKTAMYIQLVYLLRGRVQDEGMPQMMVNTPALVNQILLAGDIKKKEMVVDTSNFGTVYKGLLTELLEEADFSSKDDKVYTSILTDSSARRAADGMDLVSSGKEGESGKLSEAVMGRMGANIIKRLSLLLKTVKMYSSADHPSISLALETLHNGIDDLLQDREKVSLSRLGSDVLIEDVKLKKAAQFINDFAIALEER